MRTQFAVSADWGYQKYEVTMSTACDITSHKPIQINDMVREA
jgi:hypothetical protein